MIPLCTVEQVRQAERAAIAAGTSEPDLMRRAGNGVADLIATVLGSPGKALVLVGPGNNGGDGLVAAARLTELGWRCTIWSFKRAGVTNAPIAPAVAGTFRWVSTHDELFQAAQEADVALDAVFGVGGRAGLPGAVTAAFEILQRQRLERSMPIWALDIPSGSDADTGEIAEGALIADVTVMVGLPKLGLYRTPALRHAGRLWLVEIGLSAPSAAGANPVVPAAQDARRLLPRRPRDAHKHGVGWLMVVGGAPSYYGAPRMAAEAAMRAGAGLVSLAVPRSLVAPIATGLPEATFTPLADDDFGDQAEMRARAVREALPRFRALLVGPGLGRSDTVDAFLARLFGLNVRPQSMGFGASAGQPNVKLEKPAVIDADGLNWLADHDRWPDLFNDLQLVLTPHPGEMSRLTKRSLEEIEADPWSAAREAAEWFRQVVVLKLGHAVVAAPGEPLVLAPQCEPALATAGTGDVLAGTIAGLLAQGLRPHEAAASGIYVGAAAAGRALARAGTLGLVAGDVIHEIAPTLRQLYDSRGSVERKRENEQPWESTWTWPAS